MKQIEMMIEFNDRFQFAT